MEGARHVEIQIVGDQHGEVLALSSRDCTIQRRCQKVIEEAPATIVPKKILRKMEKDAINFARFVDYYSAGTVELLFIPATAEYYFLELNPRLQVEHPCTEAVCDVNVPALQFQIAMGLKLAQIPDICRYKAMKSSGNDGKIHSIAARVTCEDPADRFLPSTGHVKSLKFGSTSKAWAYFSVCDGSTVHEFADSQIGHVFARGRDRPEAIANLKHALQNLKIDATFPTQSHYLIDLLSLEKFKNNAYDTQWLDQRIANRDGQKSTIPIDHLIAISAAAIGNLKIRRIFENYETLLKSGKIVLPVELSRTTDVDLQLENVKYSLKVFEETTSKYQIRLGAQQTTVEILKIGKDGRQKIAVHQGKSTEFQLEETEDFYAIKFAENKLKFAKTDSDDASVLRSPYTGKFLEYKVSLGEFVQVGQTYAQIESMKMVFDVVVKVAPGRLVPISKEGDLICPGSVLSRLEIDKEVKEQLKTSEKFDGRMDGWRVEEKSAIEKAKLILEGRGCMDYPLDELIPLLFTDHPQEHQILQLLDHFIDTERHFDPHDGFDESVQRLQTFLTHSEQIVDRIHSNTHVKTKSALISRILDQFLQYFPNSEEFPSILHRLFIELKQTSTRISHQAAEILFEIAENCKFSKEKSRITVKNLNFAASAMQFSKKAKRTVIEEIDMALLSFACYSGAEPAVKFVANRVEIETIDGDFEVLEAREAILKRTERLVEAEVKEINRSILRIFAEFFAGSENNTIKFSRPWKTCSLPSALL
uniref:Acetyl-CoA carboxylase n=1 Tax=Caenorhabditis japonica TaxID=281687 RepID=A0A8R1HKE9_CAEJA